jgi:hypothetical protein
MSDIFLSYSRKDKERAKIIAEALERYGYSVFWDMNILLGGEFDNEIEEELDAAKCVVVLWSKDSVKSKWVKTEASEGDKRKILVPVLIDDIKIPLEFRRNQAALLVDWQRAFPNPDFDIILKNVGEKVGKPPVIKIEDKKPIINEPNISTPQVPKNKMRTANDWIKDKIKGLWKPSKRRWVLYSVIVIILVLVVFLILTQISSITKPIEPTGTITGSVRIK